MLVCLDALTAMSCLFFFFRQILLCFQDKTLEKNVSHFFHIVRYSDKFMHHIVLHSIVLFRCLLYCIVNLFLGGYNTMPCINMSEYWTINPLFVQCKTKEMFKVLLSLVSLFSKTKHLYCFVFYKQILLGKPKDKKTCDLNEL